MLHTISIVDTDGRIHCESLRRPHYRPHFVHPQHYSLVAAGSLAPPAVCGSNSTVPRATAYVCFTDVERPVIRNRKFPHRGRKHQFRRRSASTVLVQLVARRTLPHASLWGLTLSTGRDCPRAPRVDASLKPLKMELVYITRAELERYVDSCSRILTKT